MHVPLFGVAQRDSTPTRSSEVTPYTPTFCYDRKDSVDFYKRIVPWNNKRATRSWFTLFYENTPANRKNCPGFTKAPLGFLETDDRLHTDPKLYGGNFFTKSEQARIFDEFQGRKLYHPLNLIRFKHSEESGGGSHAAFTSTREFGTRDIHKIHLRCGAIPNKPIDNLEEQFAVEMHFPEKFIQERRAAMPTPRERTRSKVKNAFAAPFRAMER